MAGSGRFPGWRVPIPMPGWQAGRPPAYPDEDHRARQVVLGDHVEACYEGRRIVMIPECKLRVLLPRMISQRADLRAGGYPLGRLRGADDGLGAPQHRGLSAEEKGGPAGDLDDRG